jgi:signal transduction histidine kinase
MVMAAFISLMADIAMAAKEFDSLSLSQLEQQLKKTDNELETLAQYSMRSGMGSIGYRSKVYSVAEQKEWLQIDLERETSIDQIVLVPSIWRDTKTGFQADGFPEEFRLLAGSGQITNVIASFTPDDQLLPRIAPLVIPCSETASWVRLEATKLSPRAFDGRFNLELAEIMIFSGQENVALKRSVQTPTSRAREGSARHKSYLVDGFVPYLMDAASGEKSIAMVTQIGIGPQPTLTIDLEESRPLNRIHIHAVDLSDTIPQSTSSDFGIPSGFVVEGANRADFSDSKFLYGFHKASPFDIGPILTHRFRETPCRYVRLTAQDPYMNEGGDPGTRIGFAEIELFSNGENIARGKTVSANFTLSGLGRSFEALTDGRNLYGDILPIRSWMNELARRHELETIRPLIINELNRRYNQQKATVRFLSWLAALLIAATAFSVLFERMLHIKQLARTKQRFAADLHDELGANLHAIGLLSDLVDDAKNNPDGVSSLVQRIRNVTERTGIAVRHITDMQKAEGLFSELQNDMQRAAERIVNDLEHEVFIEGEEHLKHLSPRRHADLFLFYKECLVNIARHSGATHLVTRLKATRSRIYLEVQDNGRGIENSVKDRTPSSLKRRAQLLRAYLSTEHPPSGGTRIELSLRTRRPYLLNRRGKL